MNRTIGGSLSALHHSGEVRGQLSTMKTTFGSINHIWQECPAKSHHCSRHHQGILGAAHASEAELERVLPVKDHQKKEKAGPCGQYSIV